MKVQCGKISVGYGILLDRVLMNAERTWKNMPGINDAKENKRELKDLLKPLYKICEELDSRIYGGVSPDKKQSSKFIMAQDVFDFLKYLSVADGDISDSEAAYIGHFLGFKDYSTVKKNIASTVAAVELGMTTVPSFFRRIVEYCPEKADVIILFFDALGRQFISVDNRTDVSEKTRLSGYINMLRDFRKNNIKEQAKEETREEKKDIKRKEDPFDIDFDLPFDRRTYTIENILKTPEDIREHLCYRISFVGQIRVRSGNWRDCHFIVSTAHRCIYAIKVDPVNYQMPGPMEYEEKAYVKSDYSGQLFSPEGVTQNGEWFVLKGNGFILRSMKRRVMNSLFFAMILSDHYLRKKQRMYVPAKISGEKFTLDMEEWQRYSVYNDYDSMKARHSHSEKDLFLLNNIVFRFYDEYMDTMASGYLMGLLAQVEKWGNGEYGISFMWFGEDVFDIRFQKTESLAAALKFMIFFDPTSELYCDREKLTLYHTLHSRGLRCIELKFSDERQFYSFGEWMGNVYPKAGSSFRIIKDAVPVFGKKDDSSLRKRGFYASEITREGFLRAGLDEERLSYYEKGYGLGGVFTAANSYMYERYYFNRFQTMGVLLPEKKDVIWRLLHNEGVGAGFASLTAVERPVEFKQEPEKLTIMPNKVAIDFSDRSPLEYNMVVYLYDKWFKKEMERRIRENEENRKKNREKELEEALSELECLTGLSGVKEEVKSLISFIELQKKRGEKGLKNVKTTNHLVFTGNPGTGKTTVARIIGRIYYALGIIDRPEVKEVSRADLVEGFIGQTAPKTMKVLEEAKGGILFIDEAYTLKPEDSQKDFGQEAIDTILKYMEDNRDSLIVIAAGYRKEMQRFIKSNPGLESRFNRFIDFSDYNGDELYEILMGMCRSDEMKIKEEEAPRSIRRYLSESYEHRDDYFSNGRMVRNFYEGALKRQAARISKEMREDLDEELLSTLLLEDFGIEKEKDAAGDAMEALMSMTGLSGVKEEIRKLTAFLTIRKEREKLGIVSDRPSLHMVFTGNPGTGKTTVARYIAEIFKELGILSKGDLVETDRAGLVAGYVGQTAIKTKEVIEYAKGGVLFIDEAYTLTTDNRQDQFGQEAVDTLLKAMEDYRDDLVVIVAGYDEPMKKFINSNPGLASRFNRYIHFDDYDAAELTTIFAHYCEREQFKVSPGAMEELARYFSRVDRGSFGNGRGARNLFERVKSAQALRLMGSSFDKDALMLITEEDIISAEEFR